MDWIREHSGLLAGLALGTVAVGGLGFFGYRRINRWRRNLNMNLEHRSR